MWRKGVACCDHTCNNPMLNQMVVNIISLPGVMSPEVVEEFKLAIEKMGKKSLEEQVEARADLLKQLQAAPSREKSSLEKDAQADSSAKPAKEDGAVEDVPVEGYKMEDVNSQDRRANSALRGYSGSRPCSFCC